MSQTTGSNNRKGGIVYVRVGGELLDGKGSWTYGLGLPKQEGFLGTARAAGYKTVPQIAFIEGALTDANDFDLAKFQAVDGETVTLELANGKSIVLSDAWYAGEGTGSTEEGEISVRFESRSEGVEV